MTRDQRGEGILAKRGSHCAGCSRIPQTLGDPPIARRLAEWNVSSGVPNLLLKGRKTREVERRKRHTRSFEVSLQQIDHILGTNRNGYAGFRDDASSSPLHLSEPYAFERLTVPVNVDSP